LVGHRSDFAADRQDRAGGVHRLAPQGALRRNLKRRDAGAPSKLHENTLQFNRIRASSTTPA
jgi:hypothetical protein